MSSMVIPMMPTGSSGAGGGSYIQVYADAPQYIEGKYLRVSLNGTEIYADSIPTNVDALTLQITEAGTYTIAVYASSSSATAEESHTVLVDSLTANYSVRIGDAAYVDKTETVYYYTASDTGLLSWSNLSGSVSTMNEKVYVGTAKSYTFKGTGTLKLVISATGTGTVNAGVDILDSNGNVLQEMMGNHYNVNSEFALGVSGSLKVRPFIFGRQNNAISVSDMSVKVCGTSNSVTMQNKGITAKGIKSVQVGSALIFASPSTVYISNVNPQKAICEYWYRGSNNYPWYINVSTPNSFTISGYSNGANMSWRVIEFY